MKNYPRPGEKWNHYKGGEYEIITLAVHTETQERLVVYKSLNFGSVYVRPYEIWNSESKDGEKRFTLIDAN